MQDGDAREHKVRENVADDSSAKLITTVSLRKELNSLSCATILGFREVEPGEFGGHSESNLFLLAQ